MIKWFAIPICLFLGTCASQPPADYFSPSFPACVWYCIAGSRPDPHSSGYGPAFNFPRPLDRSLGTPGKVALIALPEESVMAGSSTRGFRLCLVNRSGSEVFYVACDSVLNIVCEAKNAVGEWRAIERLPAPYCGNSFHHVFLPDQHYWEFHAPVYTGSIPTKLRYALRISAQSWRAEPPSRPGDLPLYSNEFEGRINPEALQPFPAEPHERR